MRVESNIPFAYLSARAKLHLYSPSEAILVNMESRERGQGHATGLMKELVAYADEHRIDIELYAQAFEERTDGLDNRQLEAFYSKYGFTRDPAYLRAPLKMLRPYLRSSHE